ncbi:glycosyltransferase family 2 protein [Aquabacterium sp.]|uniref:glycosyltransferase family 2 protein n=1 Tax=Aquabacterium sp. TaxID=1872578 RepID=UPI002E316A47|nr:glycosyltransferase family 2 protein [Aquabacterium sp.]HEX5310169.1 glycosyltransferase family 2 protein [Aquabacterium sp.]
MLELKTHGIQAQTISVIVPCRNERDHIDVFCASVLEQRIPEGWDLEVLIADGRSDDGTRERLSHWVQQDPRFALIDNPGRIVSTGLNRCIERARGSFIVRLDVHTVYAHDYIEQCLKAWQRTGADNVGGPWRAMGKPGQKVQQAIAAAFQSKWVSGGALSRDLNYEGEADTVYLGAWPRQTFERFGGFDENLVRNQDDEHNLRIHKGGGRIWQSALIRSTYQPRASVGDVFRQYRQYGYWKPFVMKKHGQAAALRHLVPGLFVASLIGLLVLMLGFGGLTLIASSASTLKWVSAWGTLVCSLGLMALCLTYGLAVLLVSLSISRELGGRLLGQLPDVIAAYHFGYGLGSIRGWLDVWGRGRPNPTFGRLTRGDARNRT